MGEPRSMKVNGRLIRGRLRVCKYKVRLELENAQAYLLAAQNDTVHYHNPATLELYLCPGCGYLHIGHGKRRG
jgi:hypothetical protein